MPNTHVRVLGGGNTYVHIGIGKGTVVEFLSEFTDTPGQAVGRVEPIQPIGSPYPIEIATPYAQGAGQITMRVWGTWGSDGWVSAFQYENGVDHDDSPWNGYQSRLNTLDGKPVDLKEVMEAQRKNGQFLTVKKFELGANGDVVRIKNYQGVVITNIQAGETIRNDTMTDTCQITMQYTKMNVTQS